MYRFVKPGFTALAAGLATYAAPVALADSQKKKSIYDDSDDSVNVAPVPGTNKPVEQTEKAENNNSLENNPLAIKTEVIGRIPVKSSEFLEENVEKVRKWVLSETENARDQVDGAFQRYLKSEKRVTSTIAGLKSEDEDMLPGTIYVLIAGLSGSVFARRHNFLARATLPVILGVGAFRYFLPETFKNTSALVWSWEQKSPVLADAHIAAYKQADDLVSGLKSAVANGQEGLESGVHKTREFIASSTGLQIGGGDSKSKK